MDKYELRKKMLKSLVTSHGRGGISSVASKIGKDASYVSRLLYKSGKRGAKRIGEDTFDLLASAYPDFFEKSNAPVISMTGTRPGYIRFPLMDGFVAAGGEGYISDYPEIVEFIDISEEWAKRNIHVAYTKVRLITARGDSMDGDLSDGDILFVDSSEQSFKSDAIYVLNWHGRPLVKRLQARMDGSVVIRSTNPAYESETVSADEISQLYISGRVIAAWKFKRF